MAHLARILFEVYIFYNIVDKMHKRSASVRGGMQVIQLMGCWTSSFVAARVGHVFLCLGFLVKRADALSLTADGGTLERTTVACNTGI